MDVNGTRYQVLLSYNDWAQCIAADGPDLQRLAQSWQAGRSSSGDSPPHAPPLSPVNHVDANGQGGEVCSSGTAWDAEHAELTLRPRLFQFPPRTGSMGRSVLSQDRRRAASQDYAGRWFWISDTSTELLMQRPDMTSGEHFWSSDDDEATARAAGPPYGDFQPVATPVRRRQRRLSGLTITIDQYLVVGVEAPAGLLIFDLYTSEPPRQLHWPTRIPFVPFDIAARPGGGIVILDRIHTRYWVLDRYFTVQEQEQTIVTVAAEQVDVFQDAVGVRGTEALRETLPVLFPEGIALNLASPLASSHAVAIDVLPDDTVLVLESDPDDAFSHIAFYRFGQQVHAPVSLAVALSLVPHEERTNFTVRGHDFAFVAPSATESGIGSADGGQTTESDVLGRLYIVGDAGKQCYAFTLVRQRQQLALQPLSSFLPMRLFGGRGLVVVGQQVFYDSQNVWLPLVEQPRPRFALTATLWTPLSTLPGLQVTQEAQVGELITDASPTPLLRPAFDGHMTDCVWHRLMLDAWIPPETQVQVWSRAANEEEALVDADWQQEPDLYLRCDGSELPFTPLASGAGNGTWEVLFQAARGRYLQVQLVLTGNGRTTPQIRAMRVYYPRFSYLEHYLPAVYREDANSASFVERFLANVEGFFTTIEDKIAAATLLFDVRSVPAEALDWLANWFGIALDMAWSEQKKRLFLKHAMEYFQYRGTMRGLLVALYLALEDHPDATIFRASHHTHAHARASGIAIVEHFRQRRFPPAFWPAGDEEGGTRPARPLHAARPAHHPVPSPYQSQQNSHWLPEQGGEQLNQLYEEFLRQEGLSQDHGRQADDEASEEGTYGFPLAAPTDAVLDAAWRQFAQQTLGFIPMATEADLALWQQFLLQRYQRIAILNAAYRTTYTSFWQVPLLSYLTRASNPCYDWYVFEGVVLQIQHSAHQFTVYIPLPATRDTETMQQQRYLVQRVLASEKPAHTLFEVQFYSSAFQVGSSLLGDNTQIGVGSRSALMPRVLILGEGMLADGYLTSQNIQGLSGSYAVGQEQVRG